MACFSRFLLNRYAAPQIIFIIESGDLYQRHILESDAEVHYLARIKEFVDGNAWKSTFMILKQCPNYFLHMRVDTCTSIYCIRCICSKYESNIQIILPALLSLIIYWFLIRLNSRRDTHWLVYQ